MPATRTATALLGAVALAVGVITTPTVSVESMDSRCRSAVSVPWTSYFEESGSSGDPIGQLLSARGEVGEYFCLQLEASGTYFLGDTIPLYISSIENTLLLTGRESSTGFLRVLTLTKRGFRSLQVPDSIREFQVEGRFLLDGALHLVAYNPARSGTAFSSGEQLLNIVKLEKAQSSDGIKITDLGPAIPGGLDEPLQTAQLNSDRALVCKEVDCWQVSQRPGRDLPEFQLLPSSLSQKDTRILEVATTENGTVGMLVQHRGGKTSATYQICTISPSQTGMDCVDIKSPHIPYKLRAGEGNEFHYFLARNRSELGEVFVHDVARFRSGVGWLGSGNNEGRVVWSSTYLINGLVDLSLDPSISEGLKEQTLDRLRVETSVLCNSDRYVNSMESKRYSLNREDLIFLLHVSRVLYTLNRVLEASPQAIGCTEEAVNELVSIAVPGVASVEELSSSRDDGVFDELRYKRGEKFWADGVNVPFNYQSAWILAAQSSIPLSSTPTNSAVITRMLDRFWESTKMKNYPQDWAYSDGVFADGWGAESFISINTPSYVGDQNPEHIADVSYRTMDIMALMEASDRGFFVLPTDFDGYVLELIGNGDLWPFALESIETKAVPGQCQNLVSFSKYTRSNAHFETQNQVWALFGIGKTEVGVECGGGFKLIGLTPIRENF